MRTAETTAVLPRLLLLPFACLLAAGMSCLGTPDSLDAGEVPNVESTTCPIELITVAEETCAPCSFGTICGVVDEAPCEVRENSQGDACQLCMTSSGTVLYDDCFIQGEVDAAVCEPSPASDPTTTCTTCFDSLGAAVSTTCAPVSDFCEDVTISGRSCNVCSRDGAVVSTTCETADLDPRLCVAYGNSIGRCVDCYDDNNVVIVHSCTPDELESDAGGESEGSPGAVSCEQRVVDGVSCTVCYDDAGQFVSQQCSDGAPSSERCERLAFTEQVCQVCVDSSNAVTFVDCVDADCSVESTCRSDADCFSNQACYDGVCTARTGDGSEGEPNPGLAPCVEPPTCEMFNNRDGQFCRSCPTSSGATEVRCMSNSSLVCEVVAETALPAVADDTVAEEAPSAEISDERNAQGRSCVLCNSPALNVEVYRDCEGNGAVPPPACVETTTLDGAVCTACFDAVTGGTVYSSCASVGGANDVCYGHSEHVLHDDNGTALVGDGVACKTCNDGVQTTSCAQQALCGDGLTADASSCSGDVVALQLTPHHCDNPWAAFRDSLGRDDDLAGVMAWSQAAGGFVVLSASASAASSTTTCAAGDCGCARGDVVEVLVAAGDRAAAVALYTRAGLL